jgi:arabinogalactan endo-1,4-beta-galactosidase
MRDLNQKPLVIGADISLYNRLREAGAVYYNEGQPMPLPELLVAKGYTHARLRLFHNPSGKGAQVNALDYTMELARTCVAAGMKIFLCLHYSDTWADPGKQYIPKAWENLNFDQVKEAVYAYTHDLLEQFLKNGIRPDMVQIGNEVTPGFLWEHGRVSEAHYINSTEWSDEDFSNKRASWRKFAQLLNSGIRATRDVLGNNTEIMIHVDRGGDAKSALGFFHKLSEFKLDFDSIGLSYYPFWHGTLEDLKNTIVTLHDVTGKAIHVAEVALPAVHHPIYGGKDAKEAAEMLGITGTREVEYPISPEGQAEFLQDLHKMLLELRPQGASGLFYWAPEWIKVEGYEDEPDAGPCYARALFDSAGNALPALNTFAPEPASTV